MLVYNVPGYNREALSCNFALEAVHMWREAVRDTLGAVAFAILLLGSGATGGSCQSNSLPVDDPQTKSKVESPSSTCNSASSGVQATDQRDQPSKLKSQEKPDKGKTHVRLGTVTVGASYTRFSNGFLVPFWGYGFYPYYFGYEPFFFDPLYSSYFYEPYTTGFAY